MSKKASPTVIGAFALGAIALTVAAVAVFGSGKLFSSHPRAVAFFKGNIQGLNVGSVVTLRGVPIGTVSAIRLEVDVKNMEPIIPVYMEFDPDRLRARGGAISTADQEPLKLAIAKGLHARLATQSLVTGQLLIDLDLDPNEPRTLLGADPSTVEIPTSESDIQKLKNALSQIPLDKIAASALRLLDNADRLVSSPEVPKLLQSLVLAGESLDRLLASLGADFGPLIANANETVSSARETLATAQGAMAEMRATLATADHLMSSDLRETVKAAAGALQKSEKLLVDADSLLAANSVQRFDLDQTLRNLSAATRALRMFADELERRPNSVIVGR